MHTDSSLCCDNARKIKELREYVRARANSNWLLTNRVKEILESTGKELDICEFCGLEYEDAAQHIFVCKGFRGKIIIGKK